MLFIIPIWARLAIVIAWAALKRVLIAAQVPSGVIEAIETVLRTVGILGTASMTHQEVSSRAESLKQHCSGIGCAPELK